MEKPNILPDETEKVPGNPENAGYRIEKDGTTYVKVDEKFMKELIKSVEENSRGKAYVKVDENFIMKQSDILPNGPVIVPGNPENAGYRIEKDGTTYVKVDEKFMKELIKSVEENSGGKA
jgi:hypothetical protein